MRATRTQAPPRDRRLWVQQPRRLLSNGSGGERLQRGDPRGVAHALGGTERGGVRFHHATQDGVQFKT